MYIEKESSRNIGNIQQQWPAVYMITKHVRRRRGRAVANIRGVKEQFSMARE
jgi:hypothetical protein